MSKVPTPGPAATEATAAAAVRAISCPLCAAAPPWHCATSGSHLSRWLRAFALGRITREQLVAAVGGLVVIAADQLVQERAA